MNAGVSGGWEPYSYIALGSGSTNQDSTVVKDAGGNIGFMVLCNVAAAVRWAKLYNQTTAPTEANTPAQRCQLLANSITPIDCGASGLTLAEGICFRLTVNEADSDATAVTAGDVIVNMGYL